MQGPPAPTRQLRRRASRQVPGQRRPKWARPPQNNRRQVRRFKHGPRRNRRTGSSASGVRTAVTQHRFNRTWNPTRSRSQSRSRSLASSRIMRRLHRSLQPTSPRRPHQARRRGVRSHPQWRIERGGAMNRQRRPAERPPSTGARLERRLSVMVRMPCLPPIRTWMEPPAVLTSLRTRPISTRRPMPTRTAFQSLPRPPIRLLRSAKLRLRPAWRIRLPLRGRREKIEPVLWDSRGTVSFVGSPRRMLSRSPDRSSVPRGRRWPPSTARGRASCPGRWRRAVRLRPR